MYESAGKDGERNTYSEDKRSTEWREGKKEGGGEEVRRHATGGGGLEGSGESERTGGGNSEPEYVLHPTAEW